MNIVLVHYHLRTGGVTRVMDDAAQALLRLGHRVALLTGEPPAPDALRRPLPVATLPALAYGLHPNLTSEDLLRQVRRAARQLLGAPPDLWHIHNHALGKNNTLPLLAHALAREGEPLILQPHDFAEDGRPANYAFLRQHFAARHHLPMDHLYPQAPHIVYAVLNDRDAEILRRAGFPRVTLLPNPVAPLPHLPDPADFTPQRLHIYPTRAIRRKNIGEFLLLALLSEDPAQHAVTRAPRNPAERTAYEQWVRFAAETRLNIQWEYGAQCPSMQAVYQSAASVLTTSVAEGFGLVYLEPWLAERPLAGRNLPHITRSLCDNGLDLSALYTQLNIPLEWIGIPPLRSALQNACTQRAQALGIPPDPDEPERLLHAITPRNTIDFGRLNETMQRTVIRHLADSPADRALLTEQLPPPASPHIVRHNRRIVTEHYHPDRYGQRLTALYAQPRAAGPLAHIDPQHLLRAFQQPETFTLLRTT